MGKGTGSLPNRHSVSQNFTNRFFQRGPRGISEKLLVLLRHLKPLLSQLLDIYNL